MGLAEMEELPELLPALADVLTQEPKFVPIELAWVTNDCQRQSVHQVIYVRNYRVHVTAVLAFHDLNTLQDNWQPHFVKPIIPSHDWSHSAAVAALFFSFHSALLLASTEKTVIRYTLSTALKLNTIPSHLPSGSHPSTVYFHSLVLTSTSGGLKIMPARKTCQALGKSKPSAFSSSRKCFPGLTVPPPPKQ